MPHIHWVARQNKLEIPNDEEEVNTREIHKCDGQAHDPDTMVVPLTPKPTRKAEALAKAPPTIAWPANHNSQLSDETVFLLISEHNDFFPELRKHLFSQLLVTRRLLEL